MRTKTKMYMSLERITITIKKDLLEKLDSIIEGKEAKNRSHAIERLIYDKLDKIDTVLIMAGGYNSPAMTNIENKPILEKQIEMLKRNGVCNLFVSINKKDKKTHGYFSDGSKFGVNIKYIIEDKPLGTGGAIAFMEGNFAMLNVDTLLDININEIYEFHKKNSSIATLLVTAVKDPERFGSVKMSGNKIIEFIEKPKTKDPSLLINAGFGVFNKEIKKYLDTEKIMIQDLFNSLIKDGKIYAYVTDKPIIDVLK